MKLLMMKPDVQFENDEPVVCLIDDSYLLLLYYDSQHDEFLSVFRLDDNKADGITVLQRTTFCIARRKVTRYARVKWQAVKGVKP